MVDLKIGDAVRVDGKDGFWIIESLGEHSANLKPASGEGQSILADIANLTKVKNICS